jgi:N-acetylmuramoyl-L-alanine amidase
MAVIKKYNLTQYDNISSTIPAIPKFKVAIDAGHGSNTAGKRTPDGYREHWINVKCANYFDIAMKRCGIETLKVAWNDTNSTDDVDVSLTERQKQVKNANCDISVSWHANAHGNGQEYTTGQGVETLIHNDSSKVGDSKNLAYKVQTQLVKGTIQKNRGVKTQALSMCNCLAMGTRASILIEIGFMTNDYESGLLKTDAFCLECAEESAKGVCEYLGIEYKSNIGNSTTIKPNITSSTTSTTSPIKNIVKVNTTLNIRNKPNGTKVGSLKNGDEVEIFDYQNGWFRVGTDKWVSADYIHNTYGRVTASVLNLRSGAGKNFADIGDLKQNTNVRLLKESNGWYMILSGTKFGWVSGEYIDIL